MNYENASYLLCLLVVLSGVIGRDKMHPGIIVPPAGVGAIGRVFVFGL